MKKAAASKKSSKPLLALGGGVALLLLSLVVFLLPLAGKVFLQSRLSKTTGLLVRIGQVHFSLTRPRFLIKDLEFLNSKGFPPAPLARIGEVRVGYLPPAVLGEGFELAKVEIDFKEFRLVRSEAGSLNLPAPRPVPLRGERIGELVLNLGPLTYTDLSGERPLQQSYDLKLEKALYRNVKGVSGILEILNWEILKRTGVEEKPKPPAKPVPLPAPAPAK